MKIPVFDPNDPMAPRDPDAEPWKLEQEITAFRFHHGTKYLPSGAIAPVALIELQVKRYSEDDSPPYEHHARLFCEYTLIPQFAAAFAAFQQSWEQFQASHLQPPEEGGPTQ